MAITSAETSINKRQPAICGLVRLKAGQVVYDHGCGKYPQYVREWAESHGCECYSFDPYHSTPAEAVRRIGLVFRGGADVVLLSNVLNVISTAEDRAACLRAAAYYMKEGGKLCVTVYEGDGKGVGRVTKRDKAGNAICWQENRKTADYVAEIQAALPTMKVSRSGRLIIAE